MWGWLSELSGGAATFVGALTGSLIGLLALLVGALFNAHLNRKRDDRLRTQEMRAVAAAIRAEFTGLIRALAEPYFEVTTHFPGGKGWFLVPDILPRIRLLPELLPKLGLLDVETIGLIIDAQIAVEEHRRYLRLKTKGLEANDGEGDDGESEFRLPSYEKTTIQHTNKQLTATIQKAIEGLDHYLL